VAWYPGARKRDLGKNTSQLTADDLVLQLHTMVGNLTGTDNYFRTVGTFSHFGIGGTWGADARSGLDGVVYQWGDTARRAAASLNGNRRTISIETADNAALPIQPWTDKQCDAIVSLMVWANQIHGIPLELIPDSKPGRRGVAYHRLGIDPWRVPDGELWSSSAGKLCPGDARISQIPALIDRARGIVAGPPVQEDLSIMDPDTQKYLDGKFAQLSQAFNITIYGDERVDTRPDTHPYNLQSLSAKVDALQASVDALKPPPAPAA